MRFLIGCSLFAAACSGGGSPTSPSPAGDTGFGAATIRGQVRVLGGNGSGPAPTALTVSVLGSSVSAPVDESGGFTLANVEPGPVQLRFTGPGVDAQVDIGPVQSGQTIDVEVIVSGSGAVLENPIDSGDDIHAQGVVTGLGGACPNVSFRVTGILVRTSAATMFDDDGCAALANGDRVRVDGTQQPDGSVQATEVEVDGPDDGSPDVDGPDDTSDDDGEVRLEGTVTSLGGACPNITFRVDGILVLTSAATMFEHGDCATLRNGEGVRVDGHQQPNGSVQATEVDVDEPEDDDAPETVALDLEIDPDEWRLDWAAGSQSGGGGANLRVRISGNGANQIDSATIEMSGPSGTISPVSLEHDDDVEAEFAKADAIGVIGGAQDGETVSIAVHGQLVGGTPFILTRDVDIEE